MGENKNCEACITNNENKTAGEVKPSNVQTLEELRDEIAKEVDHRGLKGLKAL